MSFTLNFSRPFSKFWIISKIIKLSEFFFWKSFWLFFFVFKIRDKKNFFNILLNVFGWSIRPFRRMDKKEEVWIIGLEEGTRLVGYFEKKSANSRAWRDNVIWTKKLFWTRKFFYKDFSNFLFDFFLGNFPNNESLSEKTFYSLNNLKIKFCFQRIFKFEGLDYRF